MKHPLGLITANQRESIFLILTQMLALHCKYVFSVFFLRLSRFLMVVFFFFPSVFAFWETVNSKSVIMAKKTYEWIGGLSHYGPTSHFRPGICGVKTRTKKEVLAHLAVSGGFEL